MDNLLDIPMVFLRLPSSRSSSRAPSVVSADEAPSQTLLLLLQFLQEIRERLNFSPLQVPIPDDRQLCDLSEGETVVIPFLCSALKGLKSITRQLPILTTQMGNIPSTVPKLPTFPEIENGLSPINVSIYDLSHQTIIPPPPAPTQSWPVVHLAGATTSAAPPPPPPRPRAPPHNQPSMGFNPDIAY